MYYPDITRAYDPFWKYNGCKSVVFSLEAKSDITCVVPITEIDRYSVLVEFIIPASDGGHPRRLKEIIRNLEEENSSSFETTIVRIDTQGESIVVSEKTRLDYSSQGASALYAEILRAELSPGTYRINVRNLAVIPELRGITTNIAFQKSYEGK